MLATVALVHGHVTGEASAGSEAARETSEPADLHAVANIRMEGEGLPHAVLEGGLLTQVGAALREGDVTRDRRVIEERLAKRGFLSARVRGVHVEWRSTGAHVTFVVDTGGLYRVGRVVVAGRLLRRFPQLVEVPTILAGQAWDPDRVAANLAMLHDWLARRGAHADVAMTTTIDRARLAVDVKFTVRPRPIARRGQGLRRISGIRAVAWPRSSSPGANRRRPSSTHH
jgi:hypothetical protein